MGGNGALRLRGEEGWGCAAVNAVTHNDKNNIVTLLRRQGCEQVLMTIICGSLRECVSRAYRFWRHFKLHAATAADLEMVRSRAHAASSVEFADCMFISARGRKEMKDREGLELGNWTRG